MVKEYDIIVGEKLIVKNIKEKTNNLWIRKLQMWSIRKGKLKI